jgi:hypothetical protein
MVSFRIFLFVTTSPDLLVVVGDVWSQLLIARVAIVSDL